MPEVTRDSQGPKGSQEARVSQETRAPEDPLASPSEMKIRGEACRVRWDPRASSETPASLRSTRAHLDLMESQGLQAPPGSLDHLDLMASCLGGKEQKEHQASLGFPAPLEPADRRDGKVTLGTADVQKATKLSEVFRDCQDPRASQASTGSRGGKGTKETPANTASLGSQGSRESLATLVLLGPKEQKEIPEQSRPKVSGDSPASQVCPG